MGYSKPAIVLYHIYRASLAVLLVLVLTGLTACTAHYPLNKAISSVKSVEQHSLRKEAHTERSKELLLFLTFSGGGTRAASFSYGVLEALADTQIVINGKERRLLDEVDGISSVSGGSFTAAYYGLFGDRIFEDFETKFLKHNVQSELLRGVLSPLNWPKLSSRYYDRSELAADYYDELLFEKKTFQDIIQSKGPLISINATDMALGSQFSFIGAQFAPICTDLSSFPVSRAVTASSAVPGAFTSIVLKNHAGTCGYTMPDWAEKALQERRSNSRRYQHAKRLNVYLDANKYPNIHLLDGGISDNLGVRLMLNATLVTGGVWNKLKDLNLEKTNTLAIIVVNAQKQPDVNFVKKDFSLPFIDMIGAASSVPLDQYSFETMEILRNNMDRWQASITSGRCREMAKTRVAVQDEPTEKSKCAAKTYLIELDFDAVEDEAERKHLKGLPTSFDLEPEDVDRLRQAARQILQESGEFQTFLDDLK
jgi:NTE family protein